MLFLVEETCITLNDQKSLHGWDSGQAWLGRKVFAVEYDTEEWGRGSENAELMWLEFQGPNILFRAALFPFTLIGAEKTQAFFTLLNT